MIKVDRIYVPVNMALALFHKSLKKSNYLRKGYRENRIFCLIVLPIGIAYWPLSFRLESLGPIYSAWNRNRGNRGGISEQREEGKLKGPLEQEIVTRDR